VPWQEEPDAAVVVRGAKAAGYWIAVVEITAESVSLAAMQPRYPAALVLGNERSGVSQEVLACADQALAIPMLGMANSLNVATAGACAAQLVRRLDHEPGGDLTWPTDDEPPQRLSRAEYRAWASAQPRGRFERHSGVVTDSA
jgi:tRNA (guanosine-2'-O-)-methyltransferase